jgi:hypothetical protein
MEPRFGADFGHVRVHTDDRAAASARAVAARAYTVGSHLVFGDGTYSPGTTSGRRLLAHELAHVVQQSGETSAQPTLRRWKIDGNTATVEAPGDYLGRLATQLGATFGDWTCIKPLKMQTYESGNPPSDFNERYDRYVRVGDTFDVSNLQQTTGPSLNLYLFDDGSEPMDADLAKLFYPGSKSTPNADVDIENAANSGTTPVGKMVIFGHAGGDSMWGNASTFTPSTVEKNPHSFNLVTADLFPRRCWLTRTASVRSVGCDSRAWGEDFADKYLRKGAAVTTTTESVWPRCRGKAYNPLTGNCLTYNGVEFRDSPVAPSKLLAGPFWSASDFHAAKYWSTITGEL